MAFVVANKMLVKIYTIVLGHMRRPMSHTIHSP